MKKLIELEIKYMLLTIFDHFGTISSDCLSVREVEWIEDASLLDFHARANI